MKGSTKSKTKINTQDTQKDLPMVFILHKYFSFFILFSKVTLSLTVPVHSCIYLQCKKKICGEVKVLAHLEHLVPFLHKAGYDA